MADKSNESLGDLGRRRGSRFVCWSVPDLTQLSMLAATHV